MALVGEGARSSPPISLENTEIGWTSYWTLTPSAINSWVGDELRTIGSEAKLEWRSDMRTLSVTGAAFGFNDPAGVMIADRGWALDDRPTGLLEHSREPDAIAISFGEPIPYQAHLFAEIDHRVGWYAQAAWDEQVWAASKFCATTIAAKTMSRRTINSLGIPRSGATD